MNDWFYHQNGENHGPVSVDELRGLSAGGQIDGTTLVWQQGMAQWEPYGTSAALRASPVVALASNGIAQSPGPSASAIADLHPCSECGKLFPSHDLLAYEGKMICPVCKPLFFQRIREGVETPGVFRYGTIRARFGAVFLDGILIDLVIYLPLVLWLGMGSIAPQARAQLPAAEQDIILALQYTLPAIYEILMIGFFGATLGKMAAKVKVITAEGGRVGFGRATGRHFAKILSGIVLCIGYLMAIWDPEKRALHDRICGTRVITTRD